MDFMQCNFFSPALNYSTNINVFVPTPNSDEVLNHKTADYFEEGNKFQVLYLLHGAYGDYSDWYRLTSIEKYGQTHKLAVVTPSVSNSFYQDMYRGSAYLTYILEELPAFVKSIFPVSDKREDTFVAGLSMGGYGAVKLAFEKPEQYGACASLSGALDIVKTMEMERNKIIEGPFRWDAIFECPEGLEGSDADLFALAKKRISEGRELPKLYQTVGTEDFIYEVNLSAKTKWEEIGIDFTFEEYPGIHDWDFWDTYIQRVLEWLPLKNDSIKEAD